MHYAAPEFPAESIGYWPYNCWFLRPNTEMLLARCGNGPAVPKAGGALPGRYSSSAATVPRSSCGRFRGLNGHFVPSRFATAATDTPTWRTADIN